MAIPGQQPVQPFHVLHVLRIRRRVDLVALGITDPQLAWGRGIQVCVRTRVVPDLHQAKGQHEDRAITDATRDVGDQAAAFQGFRTIHHSQGLQDMRVHAMVLVQIHQAVLRKPGCRIESPAHLVQDGKGVVLVCECPGVDLLVLFGDLELSELRSAALHVEAATRQVFFDFPRKARADGEEVIIAADAELRLDHWREHWLAQPLRGVGTTRIAGIDARHVPA